MPPANDEDLENASKVATEEAPLSSQRKTRDVDDLQLINDTCGTELRERLRPFASPLSGGRKRKDGHIAVAMIDISYTNPGEMTLSRGPNGSPETERRAQLGNVPSDAGRRQVSELPSSVANDADRTSSHPHYIKKGHSFTSPLRRKDDLSSSSRKILAIPERAVIALSPVASEEDTTPRV